MPWLCTAEGSCGRARLTRFCTSTCANEGSVPISKNIEGHVARRGARRVHVDHVVGAIDLLFDGRGHVIGHDLRIGTGVRRGHRNLRRRYIRVLRNRELEHGYCTGQGDDDGDHRSEDRPVNAIVGNAHWLFPPSAFAVCPSAELVDEAPGISTIFNGPSGVTLIAPSTTMRSPTRSPLLMNQLSPCQSPTSTTRCSGFPSALRTHTK